jgi:hypothetical protein
LRGDVAVSHDGDLLYVASQTLDQLGVFNTTINLPNQQVLTNGDLVTDIDGNAVLLRGLDGANSVAVSSNDQFVYVTAKNSNSVSVFERNFTTNMLTFVETITNGLNGVRGLASASDVTLTPDGRYAIVSGEESNAIAVFQISDPTTGRLQFAQLLRNNISNVSGLTEPSSLSVSSIGSNLFVGTSSGLVDFTNLALDGTLPEPVAFLTEFNAIEKLTVSTAGGNDVLTLRAAPQPEVLFTTLNTGGGNDTVVLQDLSAQLTGNATTPTTIVDLGDGNDLAQLRSTTHTTSLQVYGGAGADEIVVQVTGPSARTVINAGADKDVVRVQGLNLDPTSTTIAHGDNPNLVPPIDGNTLFFDSQGQTVTPTSPPQTNGTLQVRTPTDRGTLEYDTFEDVQVILPPVSTPAMRPRTKCSAAARQLRRTHTTHSAHSLFMSLPRTRTSTQEPTLS